MTKLETLPAFKYVQAFAVEDIHCEECEKVTAHFMVLLTNSKKMTKVVRGKQCTECLVVTEAPIK